MSNSVLKPSVTPRTAFATRARAKPCRARCSSDSRRALRVPSFCSKRMPRGTGILSLPLGPCTSIAADPICTFTPEGTAIGFFPIRDMSPCLLPDFAKQFAAQALLAGGAAGHNAARGAQDAHTQTAENAANFLDADVTPAARPRNAVQVRDHRALVRRVFQKNAQRFARFRLVDHFIGGDKALLLEYSGDFDLQLRSRQLHSRMPGVGGIAYAREHVGNGIGLHGYQLALMTPGTSPRSASPRKQMRHIWNLRI